ncbi:holo-ACP synthase [Akkermansiaceae bacterium]|jgi:holo-[acyl-carrier protein] synthase|nr:holo-ACP synthase [Akkermansiaceae bacterium]
MNLVGIGIDVVEVSRIRSSMDEFGQKFLDRIFTQQEREYCQRQKRPELHYAARFAAKEAISKAFGTGIGQDVGWLDMEILRKQSGEPEVHLSGSAADCAKEKGVTQVMVSLTHAKHYAAANAVVMSGNS